MLLNQPFIKLKSNPLLFKKNYIFQEFVKNKISDDFALFFT